MTRSPNAEYFYRLFVVSPAGQVDEGRVSHAVSAAWDILADAGYDPERFAVALFATERPGSPMTPEQFARKVVRLGKALNTC